MDPFARRSLRIVLSSFVCAGATLAVGFAIELWRFGGTDISAFERVQDEVKRQFGTMAETLQTAAALVATRPETALGATGEREAVRELFDVLANVTEQPRTPEGLALTVYGAGGTTRAWTGRPSEVPRDRVLGERAFFTAPGSLGLRLMYVEPLTASSSAPQEGTGRRAGSIVAERLLCPSSGLPGTRADDFCAMTAVPTVSLRTRAEGAGEQTDPYSFLLEAPTGEILLEASVSLADLAAARTEWRKAGAAVALVVISLGLLLAIGPLADRLRQPLPPRSDLRTLITAIVALLGARVLLWFAVTPRPGGWQLVSPASYASNDVGELFRSPADFLLSSLCLLGLVALVFLGVERLRLGVHRRRHAATDNSRRFLLVQLGGGATLAILLAGYVYFLLDTVESSSVDMLHTWLHPGDTGRLGLMAGLLVFDAAAFWAGTAVLSASLAPWRLVADDTRQWLTVFMGWMGPSLLVALLLPLPRAPYLFAAGGCVVAALMVRRTRGWFRHASYVSRLGTALLALLLPGLILYPSVLHVADGAKRQFIEEQYARQAANHPQELQARLNRALEQIDQIPALATMTAVGPVRPGTPPDTDRAFFIWRQTDLAAFRLTSAVELYDADGLLVSRFALNYPEYTAASLQTRASRCAWDVFGEVMPFGSQERRVLHAQRDICTSELNAAGVSLASAEAPAKAGDGRPSTSSGRPSTRSGRAEPFDSGHPEPFDTVRPEPVEGRSTAQGRLGRRMTFAQDRPAAARAEPGDARRAGAIVIHVVLDYQALPFISAKSPYFELLQADRSTSAEGQHGEDVELVIYGWGLSPVFSSTGDAWPLEDPIFERIYRSRDPFWTLLAKSGTTSHVYFVNNRANIYALGYPARRPFDHLVHIAEISTLAGAIFLVGLVGAGVFDRVARRRQPVGRALLREIRTSFYRRLFIAFVAAAVVPLLLLAFAIRAYFTTELGADVEAGAARTAAVARRVIEESASFQPGGEAGVVPVSDDVLIWISQVIDQHVNIFDGPQLVATSERDLFASGLLPTRTPDVVYRAIVLEQLPNFVGEDAIGALRYRVAATPVRAGAREAILTLPLTSRQQQFERQIEDLDRGILLGTTLFILIGAAIGLYMAERIADPVKGLTRATRQIARGNFDARVGVRSADELQRLVDAFNRMAAELKEQRRQLERTNRLEAWAEMARQVAHEIKNPLTPVQLSAEHLLRVHADSGRPLNPVLESCVESILKQVRILRQIAAEFSSYASSPTPRLAPTSLAALVEDVLAPYRLGLEDRIAVTVDIPASAPQLMLDRTLMARALTNILENAIQAMPGRGTLSISTHVEQDTVHLVVADTGVGLDAATLARIFEPYFSTKATGTGLGMANAKRNVELNGGTIEVASEKGRGTTVTLTFRKGV